PGSSASSDPTIPKNEPGHPIKHVFTRSIPSSQCMICHIHPGTNMVTTYFGLTWWDNEIDGDKMYPPQQRNPTEEQRYESFMRNPEGAAVRGLWNDENFLEKAGGPEFNKQLQTTQFVDCHGTVRKKATLITSGPAAPEGGRHLDALRTPWGVRRFESRDGKVFQRSMSDENKEWEIVQTMDSITTGNVHFSEKSLRAKM